MRVGVATAVAAKAAAAAMKDPSPFMLICVTGGFVDMGLK